MSFQSTGESEWKGMTYTLNTDSLAWAFYDHLMDLLVDHRVVNNTFAELSPGAPRMLFFLKTVTVLSRTSRADKMGNIFILWR